MLWLSFGNTDAYKNAVFGWKWKSVLYFFLLSLLSSASAMLATHRVLGEFYDGSIAPALELLKGVKVENGRVKTPDGADVELRGRDGKVFAVASQNYVDAVKTKDLMFAFERDRVSFYLPDGGETFFSLAGYDKLLDGRGVDAMLPSKNTLLYIIAPLACLFLFVIPTNAVFVSLTTIAAFVLSRTVYPILTFWQSARLALCALTPSIVVDIVSVSAFGNPVNGFVYALISGGMVFYVLKSFARSAVE